MIVDIAERQIIIERENGLGEYRVHCASLEIDSYFGNPEIARDHARILARQNGCRIVDRSEARP